MPNTREKLIELLGDLYCGDVGIDGCDTCDYRYEEKCNAKAFADHLIANGVTVQKWIPVTERLPEKAEIFLVLAKSNIGSGYISYLAWYKPKKRSFYIYDSEWGDIKLKTATHWMPLPEPPKGE